MPPKFFSGIASTKQASRMIAGVQVPWEVDADLEVDEKPSELFPPKPPPIAPAPRRPERTAVGHYRALRERIHEGPLYTVLGTNVRVGKARSSAKIVADPFEGMPTYTQKYKKQRRTMPRLDTRPYVLRFFPAELHATLDPTLKTAGAPGAPGALKRKRKTLQIARSNRLSRLEQLEEDGDLENEDLDDKDEDAEDIEEEKDDDFEEDEDDDDDYNAEQYFDGGDDDDYGDEGGGGGGFDEYD